MNRNNINYKDIETEYELDRMLKNLVPSEQTAKLREMIYKRKKITFHNLDEKAVHPFSCNAQTCLKKILAPWSRSLLGDNKDKWNHIWKTCKTRHDPHFWSDGRAKNLWHCSHKKAYPNRFWESPGCERCSRSSRAKNKFARMIPSLETNKCEKTSGSPYQFRGRDVKQSSRLLLWVEARPCFSFSFPKGTSVVHLWQLSPLPF